MALFFSEEAFTKQVESDLKAKRLLKLVCQEMVETEGPVIVHSLLKFAKFKYKADKTKILVDFFRKYPFLFELSGQLRDKKWAWAVEVKTDVQLCVKYLEDSDSCAGNCEDLHICKFYLLGKLGCFTCLGQHRTSQHDLYSSHNLPVLKANLLEDLLEEELRLVFNPSRCKERVLGVCRRYQDGGPSGCEMANKCRFLHLCRLYVFGDCQSGECCKRSHDLRDPQPKAILSKFGYSTDEMCDSEFLRVLQEQVSMQEKLETAAQRQTARPEREEWKEVRGKKTVLMVCINYGRQPGCDKGDNCHYLHLCNAFVHGSCKSGTRCQRSHNLLDPQPKAMLSKFGFSPDTTDDSELLTVLREHLTATQVAGLCYYYNERFGCEAADNCRYLHLCKSFMLRSCELGEHCERSHNFLDPQPKAILSKAGYNLDTMLESKLLEILREQLNIREKARSAVQAQKAPPGGEEQQQVRLKKTVFQLCRRYGGPLGCDKSDECQFLHLCKPFVFDSCKFGERCKRSHSLLDPQPKAILSEFGYSPDEMGNPELLTVIREQLVSQEEEELESASRSRTAPSGGEERQEIRPKKAVLRVCFRYGMQSGCDMADDCRFLHLCKSFIFGYCQRGVCCIRSHNLLDPQPKAILSQFGYIPVTSDDSEILAVLRERLTAVQVPGLCHGYNKRSGCENADNCRYLHLCRSFITGSCQLSERCQRSHNLLSAHSTAILSKFGYRARQVDDPNILMLLSGQFIDRKVNSNAEACQQEAESNTCKPLTPGMGLGLMGKHKEKAELDEPLSPIEGAKSKNDHQQKAESDEPLKSGRKTKPKRKGQKKAESDVPLSPEEAAKSKYDHLQKAESDEPLKSGGKTKSKRKGQKKAESDEPLTLEGGPKSKHDHQQKAESDKPMKSGGKTKSKRKGQKKAESGSKQDEQQAACSVFLEAVSLFGNSTPGNPWSKPNRRKKAVLDYLVTLGGEVQPKNDCQQMAELGEPAASEKGAKSKLTCQQKAELGEPAESGNGAKSKLTCQQKAELGEPAESGNGAKSKLTCQQKAELGEPVASGKGAKSKRTCQQMAELGEIAESGKGSKSKLICQQKAELSEPVASGRGAKSKLQLKAKSNLDVSAIKENNQDVACLFYLKDNCLRLQKAESDLQVSASKQNDQDVICSFFLRGTCLFGDSCVDFHPSDQLPYQWQFLPPGKRQKWVDADPRLNVLFETAYCNPNVQSTRFSFLPKGTKNYVADFDSMSLVMDGGKNRQKLRRLSTVSNVVHGDAGTSLGTDWKWFRRGEDGSWRLFGDEARKQGDAGVTEKVTSTFLEEKYSISPEGQLELDSVIIDFTRMQQTDKSSGRKMKILRRPVLVTPECLSMKRTWEDKRFLGHAEANQLIPDNWTDVTEPNYPNQAHAVPLHFRVSAGEYSEVAHLVRQSCEKTKKLSGHRIAAIYRLQNLRLLAQFERKKKEIQQISPLAGTALERRLFYLPHQEYIDAICLHGFDWRVKGLTPVPSEFGEGCSFFVDVPDYDILAVFVARVLTGNYTKGDKQSSTPSPPTKSWEPWRRFDSWVDDVIKPSCFVIFDIDQAYPEYLVLLKLSAWP